MKRFKKNISILMLIGLFLCIIISILYFFNIVNSSINDLSLIIFLILGIIGFITMIKQKELLLSLVIFFITFIATYEIIFDIFDYIKKLF